MHFMLVASVDASTRYPNDACVWPTDTVEPRTLVLHNAVPGRVVAVVVLHEKGTKRKLQTKG